jgi:iron complex outermembrane receptor protein
VSPSVLQALAAIGVPTPPSILNATSGNVAVQSFVNGAATMTRGIDFLATYPLDYGSWGHVDYSLAANYSNTGLNSINKPPANLNQSVQLLDQTAIADLTTASPKYRFVAAAFWTWDKVSVNLRENFYGASYQYSQNDSTGNYDKIPIEAAATTDLEIGYELIHNVKVYAGANNLFDTFPTKEPAAFRAAQFNANDNTYASSVYPSDSPFGINGGYYYGRITWTF